MKTQIQKIRYMPIALFCAAAVLGASFSYSSAALAEVAYEGGETGGNGGYYFTDPCSRRFMKGLAVRTGSRLDRVQNRCFTAGGNIATENTYHGGSGGNFGTITCASGYVVQGLYGRSGAEIDKIGLWCVEENDVKNWTDPANQTRYTSTSKGGNGGSYFSFRCQSGHGVTGTFGRTGSRVDRLGVWCKDKSPA